MVGVWSAGDYEIRAHQFHGYLTAAVEERWLAPSDTGFYFRLGGRALFFHARSQRWENLFHD